MKINQHIFLIGFMGCGKTTLAKVLAKANNMPLIDTDQYIEKKTGSSIHNIFTEKGEEAFRALEKEVLEEIIHLPPSIVSTGGGLPCFFNNMDVMNSSGITIYLQADVETLSNKLFGDTLRPLIKNKSKEELVSFIESSLEKREPYYSRAKLCIKALALTPMQMAELLHKLLENKRQTGM